MHFQKLIFFVRWLAITATFSHQFYCQSLYQSQFEKYAKYRQYPFMLPGKNDRDRCRRGSKRTVPCTRTEHNDNRYYSNLNLSIQRANSKTTASSTLPVFRFVFKWLSNVRHKDWNVCWIQLVVNLKSFSFFQLTWVTRFVGIAFLRVISWCKHAWLRFFYSSIGNWTHIGLHLGKWLHHVLSQEKYILIITINRKFNFLQFAFHYNFKFTNVSVKKKHTSRHKAARSSLQRNCWRCSASTSALVGTLLVIEESIDQLNQTESFLWM